MERGTNTTLHELRSVCVCVLMCVCTEEEWREVQTLHYMSYSAAVCVY